MKKILLIFCILLLAAAGCDAPTQASQTSTPDIYFPATPEPSATPAEAESTLQSEAIALGGGKDHKGRIFLSFEEIEKLTPEEIEEMREYCAELCYLRPVYAPQNVDLLHINIGEGGSFLVYYNEETEERFMLIWWANDTPERYLENLKEDMDRQTRNTVRKVVAYNGIDYYCHFTTVVNEPSDTLEKKTPYHAEIHWIEDGKCMYICIESKTSIDDTILDYCQIEKIIID